MKLRTLTMALALAFSGAALAADAPAPAMPQTPDAWAQMMWDFTRNPNPLKDPKQFVPFATAATEPGFYTALAMQSLDPSMWGYMANSMMNPASFSAYEAWTTRSKPASWSPRSSRKARASSGGSWAISASIVAETAQSCIRGRVANSARPLSAR